MVRLYVRYTWSDTSGHYFNSNTASTSWNALPAIQLDNPATGHKRSFEDTQTGYSYVHGWFWVRDVKLVGDYIEISGYFGGYHRADNTRANIVIVIGVPGVFDVQTRPDLPFVMLKWFLSSLGWSNGAYGQPLSGWIKLTDPPTYSFSPANPIVSYNRITQLINSIVSVLFGYDDTWATDWDQWASARQDSYIDLPIGELPSYIIPPNGLDYSDAVISAVALPPYTIPPNGLNYLDAVLKRPTSLTLNVIPT